MVLVMVTVKEIGFFPYVHPKVVKGLLHLLGRMENWPYPKQKYHSRMNMIHPACTIWFHVANI